MARKVKPLGLAGVSGLGSGIEAIAELASKGQYRVVRTEQIQVIEGHNPRGQYDGAAFSEERLAALADSIAKEGILTPLWVRSMGENYALIAGERRYRAALQAGLDELPVLVIPADAERAALLALIENAQREEMNVLDETYAGFRLMETRTGLSREDLIAHLNRVRKGREEDRYDLNGLLQSTFGSSVSTWSQSRSKILDFTPAEVQAVFARQLDYSVPLALTRLEPGAVREQLLQRAIRESLNAAQIRQLVAAELGMQQSTSQQAATRIRKILPRLSKLEGKKARQAQSLLAQLEDLVN